MSLQEGQHGAGYVQAGTTWEPGIGSCSGDGHIESVGCEGGAAEKEVAVQVTVALGGRSCEAGGASWPERLRSSGGMKP